MRALPRLLIVLAFVAAGCGPTVDLKTGLQAVDVVTGWADTGIVDGQSKLVPSVTFKLKNVSTESLQALQANAVFRQASSQDEWGSGLARVRGSEGLAPGETTDAITLRSLNGHTAAQAPAEMLTNQSFVDAKVELFAKYGSSGWTRILEQPVERQLTAK